MGAEIAPPIGRTPLGTGLALVVWLLLGAAAGVLAGCHLLLPYAPSAGDGRSRGPDGAGPGDAARLDGRARDAQGGDGAPAGQVALDPTFAGTGFYSFAGPVSAEDYAAAAAVDSAGRLVVVGQISSSVNTSGVANKDLGVWRFLPDGTLDPSFAAGGQLVVHVGPYNWDYGRGVAIDASDRIVVGGNVDYGKDSPTVWRFNVDGTPDASFGVDGRNRIPSLGAEVQGTDLAVAPGGELVVLGDQQDNWFALGRFGVAGALDPSFAKVGYLTYQALPKAHGARLRVDAAGRVIVVGSSRPRGVELDRDLTVWRFASDGTLDAAFAGAGWLAHDGAAGPAGDERGADLELDGDGAILVCGAASGARQALAVWRLLPGGSLDPGFGGQGFVVDDGGAPPASAGACRLDGRGRLVVAGTTTDGGGVPKLTLWRLLPSGALDPSFGGSGHVATDAFAGRDEHVRSLTLVGADRAIVCGNVGDGAAADLAVWRLVLPP